MANETTTANETAEALRIARLLRVARDAYRADKAARKEHSAAAAYTLWHAEREAKLISHEAPVTGGRWDKQGRYHLDPAYAAADRTIDLEA